MYTYSDYMSVKANRPIQASIGCSCGERGIIVSSEPLAPAMISRVSLIDYKIFVRCACIVCHKQGYVPKPIEDSFEATNEDDLQALLARCRDFLFSEKRCEHQNDICLSAALSDDHWARVFYTAVPRMHVVYCAKCRKRAPLQFPIGMSDYINEVLNNE